MDSEEQRMSNRQIERLLDQQTQHIKEYLDLVTTPILEQVKKTNGRTTALEKVKDETAVSIDKIKGYFKWFSIAMGCAWALFLSLIAAGHFNGLFNKW